MGLQVTGTSAGVQLYTCDPPEFWIGENRENAAPGYPAPLVLLRCLPEGGGYLGR